MSLRRRILHGVSASASIAVALCPFAARAQTTTLTLANSAVTFPAPTAADYVNGFVNAATGVTFTINATKGASRTTTISVRATSASLGNGKLIGDLQWRRSDLATWNDITLTDAQVEQRIVIRNGLNDPWSNTVFFRMKLNWTSDAPGTYSANYQLTLSQTVP